jgi:hypothetical protein
LPQSAGDAAGVHSATTVFTGWLRTKKNGKHGRVHTAAIE